MLAPQNSPTPNVGNLVLLALCFWAAAKDRAYKKAGGVRPDRFEKTLLLVTIVACILFLWASVYLISPAFSGTMTPLLAVVVLGVWEIHRYRIRRKNPVAATMAAAPDTPDPIANILRREAALSDEERADLWDLAYEAASAKNLANKLEAFDDVPDSVKTALVAARRKTEPSQRDRVPLRWPWQKRLPAPTPMKRAFVRLSETKEIQLAFQQEQARIFNEAAANTAVPTATMQIPSTVTDIIDGSALREGIDELERKGTLETLGFKPEHIKVFKSLAFLLGQCTRLEATPQNLAILQPLFHPGHPITPTVADAFEEMITAFVTCIE